ncbi:MAG: hypothetical protein EP299_11295 [Acidobacteria bacterium]|nr:MAG: hypothetical protein EP299_11295 [Acidobacteriota bacterium]
MSQEEQVEELKAKPEAIDRSHIAERLDSMGWGLFFLWVGVSLLFDFGWGVGLVGIGLITLGGQLARLSFELKLEGFWVVVGVGFLLGGIWELLDAEVSLVPILLILAGLTVLLAGFLPKRFQSRIE